MNNREKEIITFLSILTKRINFFVKEEFHLPKKWNIHLKYDFSLNRKRSWGGINNDFPFISLALNELLEHNVLSFDEYFHISEDKHIGSLNNISWKKYLICLVSHEIAHAVQYSLAHKKKYKKDSSNHGKVWQKIYKKIRKRFINSKISYSKEFCITIKPRTFNNISKL